MEEMEGGESAGRREVYEPPAVEPVVPVVSESLIEVHMPCSPPETCQKIPRATKAINAVIRQYSARSWPLSSSSRKRFINGNTIRSLGSVYGLDPIQVMLSLDNRQQN